MNHDVLCEENHILLELCFMAGSNFKPKTFPGFRASPLNKCTAMEHAQTFICTHSIQGVTHTHWDIKFVVQFLISIGTFGPSSNFLKFLWKLQFHLHHILD